MATILKMKQLAVIDGRIAAYRKAIKSIPRRKSMRPSERAMLGADLEQEIVVWQSIRVIVEGSA